MHTQEQLEHSVEQVVEVSSLPLLPSAYVLLRRTWGWYVQNLRSLVLLFALPFVLSTLPLIFDTIHLFNSDTIILPLLSIVGSLVSICAGLGLLTSLSVGALSSDVRAVCTRGYERLLPFLWLSVLHTVVLIGGFALLIIPGIVLSILSSQAVLVLVVENRRGFDALVQSWHYVSGYWFAVFVRLFALFFVVVFSGVLLGLVLSVLGIASTPQLEPAAIAEFARAEVQSSSLITILAVGVLSNFFITPFVLIFLFELFHALASAKGRVSTSSRVEDSARRLKVLKSVLGVGVFAVALFFVSSFVLFNYAISVLDVTPGLNQEFLEGLQRLSDMSPTQVQELLESQPF